MVILWIRNAFLINLSYVRGKADGLGRADQIAANRLFNPVAGVATEGCVHRRIETFDGAEQTKVAFGDEVFQSCTAAEIFAGNVDDKAKVGADQMIACRHVTIV